MPAGAPAGEASAGPAAVLDSFFQVLEVHWSLLSPQERSALDASTRLRAEAMLRVGGGWSMLRLREGLRACLVRSRVQDEAFDRAFIDCFGALDAGQLTRELDLAGDESPEALVKLLVSAPPALEEAPAAPPPRLEPVVDPAPPSARAISARGRQRKKSRFALVTGVAAGVAAALVVVVTRDRGTAPGPAMVERPPPPGALAVANEATMVRVDTTPHLAEPSTPPPPGIHEALGVLGLLCALGTMAWVYRGYWPPRRKLALDDRAPRLPLALARPAAGAEADEPHLASDELDQLAMAVSLVLGPSARPSIDPKQSVIATAGNAGFPTVVPREERHLRKLLILADGLTGVLHDRPLHRELAAGLQSRGVPVELGHWSGTLARFEREDSPVPGELERIQQQDVVLIVISDGRGIHHLDQELSRLADYEHVVWIDPRDPACWGATARAISGRFPIIPPTSEGWQRLAQQLRHAGVDRALPPTFLGAVRPHLAERAPGIGPRLESLSPVEKRQVEAALGPVLPWACALAAYPLPVPSWYAQRVRRELTEWAGGPEGSAVAGLGASFRAVTQISIDRLCLLPGVRVLSDALDFEGPLRHFLLRDIMEARWPALYRKAGEVHREALSGALAAPGTLAELERTASLALVQWQLALTRLAQARAERRTPDRDARRMLVDSALTLRSLQGSPVHDWGHAFVQTEDYRRGEGAVPAPAFLPVPRAADVPARARPWVRSALAGRDDRTPWTLPPAALALAALVVAAVAFGTRPPVEPVEPVTFMMGSTDGDSDEKPVHGVVLSPYFIDPTEVTVRQYRQCVQDDKCTPPETGGSCNWEVSGRDNHPVNCVTWEQADRYCRAAGKRLPTEAEWELAARGKEGRKYPWASAGKPAAQLCWDGEASDVGKGRRVSTCPVGEHTAGATPEGVQDMAGNVWEWVADWYGPYPRELTTDPRGPTSGTARVVRGGGWSNNDPSLVRGAFRFRDEPGQSYGVVGFRCARGGKAP